MDLERLIGQQTVHGTTPWNLVEKIIRERIYESIYWKTHCPELDACTLLDKAVNLRYIGGVYGNQKPTEFLCLALKLLHLRPSRDVLYEYIRQDDFKYIKSLGMLVLRLIGEPLEIYQILEPLLTNYMKLRKRQMDGTYVLTYVDEFADELLHADRVCDVILPRLPKRAVLEDLDQLEPYESPVQHMLENGDASKEVDDEDHAQEGDDETVLKIRGKLKLKATQKPSETEQPAVVVAPADTKFREEMSIDETNKMRIALGLKPLH